MKNPPTRVAAMTTITMAMTTTKSSLVLSLITLLLFGCASPRPTQAPVTIRVAYTSEADFLDLPSLMASDVLAKQGYTVVPTFFSETELAVEALARGDADIGLGAIPSFWDGISKGAKIITVMEHNGNSWSIFAKSSINTCADLDGKRFGISSSGAVSTTLTKAYVLLNCPEAEPQYLIIGRSSERAAALIADEIDATALELADTLTLEKDAPGQLHALSKFGEDMPTLKTTGIQVNVEFAAAHPEAVKAYIRATLFVHRQIAANSDGLNDAAVTQLELEADTIPALIAEHMAVNAWDVNGGLTDEAIRETLAFYIGSGDLDASLTPSQVAELSYLNAVLAEIGKQ
jgi:ABC-type nitrate/sulfonate/bicarbonate transport system substrate-binding protein